MHKHYISRPKLECGQLGFVFLSSTGHQYQPPIRYFCSVCYFTSDAEPLLSLFALASLRLLNQTTRINLFLSPWFSVLAGISPEQQPRHCLLGGRPLPVPEENQTEQHVTAASWYQQLEILIHAKPFFSPSCLTPLVTQSAVHWQLWKCDPVSLVMNFNYGHLLFFSPPPSPRVIKLWTGQVSPTHSWVFIMAFLRAASLVWSQARGPIIGDKRRFFFSWFAALCPPWQTRQGPHTLSFEVSLCENQCLGYRGVKMSLSEPSKALLITSEG